MARFVLAHDLGTTGNKASLYDEHGTLVASAFAGYDTHFERHGWAEQDPNDWWRAVCDSTHELLARAPHAREAVACLTFSGQMMGCVPLDAQARPLRSAIIWADGRAEAQVRRVAERIDPEQVYRITGHRLSSSYSLAKILWIRDQQPDLFAQTHAFVNAKDAIVARLTGRFVTDHSDASGTNLLDLENLTYAGAILEAAELDAAKLPETLPSTEVVGDVRPEVAEEVGLKPGVPVVIGGGDGACAALGAGVYREGAAYNYVGSSSWIGLATTAPVLDPSARTFTWAHVVPGMYSPCGTMQAAGASYAWARDQLGAEERAQADREGGNVYEALNALAARSPAGARGLLYLPYLLGERSPRWNPKARAAFVGLTMNHQRADMIRAVLEGVTLNLDVILRAFTDQGVAIDRMRVIGGGASGRFWNGLMAHIYGLPVDRLSHLEEATSMGAAVAGGVGAGIYPGFEVIERMNPVAETVEPDPELHARYRRLAPQFDRAYEGLVGVFDALQEFE